MEAVGISVWQRQRGSGSIGDWRLRGLLAAGCWLQLQAGCQAAHVLASGHGLLELLASREESPWESLENFRAEPALAARPVSENIDVRSSYFRAEGSADVQGVRLQLVSVLHRGSDGRARTVWRSRAPY